MKISSDHYCVYFLINATRSVLYIGVTNNLERRVAEHYFAAKDNLVTNRVGVSFTSKYQCHDLIYFEDYESIANAIAREKELKKWRRKWKEELINGFNPTWKSLNREVFEGWPPPDEWREELRYGK